MKLFLQKWWWVLAYIFICAFSLEQANKRRDDEFVKLTAQLSNLQEEKQKLDAIHDRLVLQINSQSDVEWIERVLMQKLGVVSEGQTKVFFSSATNQ